MGSRRNEYNVDFRDSIYQYEDQGGREGVRRFHPRPKEYYNGSPHLAAAAGPAGASGPLLMAAIIAVVVVVVLIVGIPLVVVLGIVLPNASTTDTVTPAPTVAPPVVPTQPPGVNPITVAPPQRTLLVKCPSDITTGTDQGLSTAVVNWQEPAVLSPTEGQVTFTPSSAPNQAYPIGRRRIDYTVIDSANNRGTCFFWITIADDEPPAIQCPAPITVPTDLLSHSAIVIFALPTVSENTGGLVTFQMTDEPGDQFYIGGHEVTIVVTDEAGNRNRCTFIITVQDREDPRITCPDNLVAYTNDPMGGAPATWPLPTVMDNDGASPQISCTPSTGSPFPYGTSYVNCTATDVAGNRESCVFQVVIRFNDTEMPIFSMCPSDFSVNATMDSDTAVVTWDEPSATDNSLMQPTIDSDISPNTALTIDTHTVTYTATDAEGNIATCTFQVEVVDIQDPTITCPASFSQNTDDGSPDATVNLPAPTTNDNSITSLTVTHDPADPPTLGIGENTVTYTVSDASGNTASCDITVTITDEEPPMITCVSIITVRAEEGESYGNISFPAPAVLSDNSGGVVNFTTAPASNSRLELGVHTVVYTAVDPSGNMAMCNLTVDIVDFQTPDLSCPANVNTTTDDNEATAVATFTATVIDNSGIITATPDYPSGSPFPIGTTVVTFTATDDSGNTNTCNFTITVRDEENPCIMCPADFSQDTDFRQPNATVALPAATASDNSMTVTVTTNPSGAPSLGIGSHTVTYTVTDDSGNAESCDITVLVNDMEPPRFTPPSNFEVLTDEGEAYATVSLPWPSDVMDNSGGEVTITTWPLNNSRLNIGPNQVTYNATDPSGNDFLSAITVTVVDMEQPDLECPADNTTSTDPDEAFATVTFEPQTLADNDGNTPTLMSNVSGDTFNIGSTVVTLTARDGAGNEISCSFLITVQDEENPSIMCPANFSQDTDFRQPNATVALPAATASDNSMTVTVTTNPSGSPSLGIGSHTVTYTVTDDSGNAESCDITVLVNDMEPPRFTPPSNFEVLTDQGEAYATVSLPRPSDVMDNSGGEVTITTWPLNNSRLDIGPNQVTYNATDPSGNDFLSAITITVVDMEPPDLECPADNTTSTNPGEAFATVTFEPRTLADNDGNTPTLMSNVSGDTFNIGSTVVTLTARDGAGNEISCSFLITVQDTEDPLIMCPDNFNQSTDGGQARAMVLIPTATASDNSPTPVMVVSDPSGSVTLEIGGHTVTYTATDDNDNAAMCNVTITVIDMEPPRFTPPSNFEVLTDQGEAYATVSLPWPSDVMDNSGGEVTITTWPLNNSRLNIGPNQVTYNATDPSGNDFLSAITVTVVDMEPPDLECPADNTTSTNPGEAFATVTFEPRTLADNDGNTPTLMSNVSGDTFNIGSTVVTLTARDGAGNEISCSFLITVQDTEDPLIMCPDNFNQSTDGGQARATVLIPAATASDNSPTPVMVVSDPSGSVTLEIGGHTVTYTATDDNDNAAMCNVTITVIDMEAPTLTLPSSFEVATDPGEAFATVSLPWPSDVMDNSGEEVTITTWPLNNSRLDIGPNQVTYNATDPSGNFVMFVINITVVDNEDPVIACPANISVATDARSANATVLLPDATSSDNSLTPLTKRSNPSGSPTFDIGSHIVTYTVTDQSGNSASCNLTLTVIDDEDPLINCPDSFNQSTDVGERSITVLIPTVMADDNSLDPVTVVSEPSGTVMLEIGRHDIVYTATDSSDNTGTCNMTIEVIDMEPPSFTPPSNFEVLTDQGEAYATVSLPWPPDVMDNSGGEVTITTWPLNNSQLDIGPNQVTYNATDPSGNFVMFVINVTVVDMEPPDLECPADNTTSTDSGEAFATVTFEPRTLADNDGNTPTLMNNASGHTFNIGSTVVTLTARDGSGNENTCTYTITVKDTEPPDLECPSEVTVYSSSLTIPLAFSGVATWTVNASDNSGLPLATNNATHESGTVFVMNVTGAPTNVTHTAVDAYNNSAQCSFEVRVIGFYTLCNSPVDVDLGELSGTGAVYHVLSPGYDAGDPYPAGSNCVWRVSAPAGTYIRLGFSDFETELLRDTLELGSGLDETAMNTTEVSFSGDTPQLPDSTVHVKDHISGDAIWLHFTSDGTFGSTLRGFLLRLDFIDDPRDLYPSSYSFCAEFGGFPCLDGSCVDISRRCDGNDNDCPGNEDETDCPAVCDAPLSEEISFPLPNGVSDIDITSDNYPGEYRPCNATWNIDSTNVMSLRVVVMDIQIGTGDRLYVVNQDTGDQVTPDIDSQVSLHITGGTNFALVFISGGAVGRGFWVRVWRLINADIVDFPAFCEFIMHGVQCGDGSCTDGNDKCNNVISCSTFLNDEHSCDAAGAVCGNGSISLDHLGSTHHLTSPRYPQDYPITLDCQYIVTTESSTIRVSFRDMEIATVGTAGDQLRIGNGATVGSMTIIEVQQTFLPEDVVSSGNQIWIEFDSGDSFTARGFWIVLIAE